MSTSTGALPPAVVHGSTTTGRLGALADRLRLGVPAASAQVAPAPNAQTGERGILDGVTLSRPFEATTTIATNVIEMASGVRDERYGKALTHGLIAGERGIVSLLRYVAAGKGVVAAGSGLLGHVLPVLNIGNGLLDIWTGWKELADKSSGPLSIIHSKTAREGILGVLAGVSLLIPGWGGILAGAAFAATSMANDLDAFHALDAPTVAIEQQGTTAARVAHPLDRTPTVRFDPARRGAVAGTASTAPAVPVANTVTAVPTAPASSLATTARGTATEFVGNAAS